MRLLTLATSALLVFASAANAQYVGVTEEVFDAGQGVFTYNRACHVVHPGSRMCTAGETATMVNPPIVGNPGDFAWLKPTDRAFPPPGSDCNFWSSTSLNNSGLTLKLEDGTFGSSSCDKVHPVACCIPVPEPSASLTIPSGVGMLFALSKLRSVSLVH